MGESMKQKNKRKKGKWGGRLIESESDGLFKQFLYTAPTTIISPSP